MIVVGWVLAGYIGWEWAMRMFMHEAPRRMQVACLFLALMAGPCALGASLWAWLEERND